MPIDTSAPAIRPPTALEFLQQEQQQLGAPGMVGTTATPDATTTAAPGATPAPDLSATPTANLAVAPPAATAAPAAPAAAPATAPQVAGQPAAGSLTPDLVGFTRDVLQNPSRFDIGVVQQGTELIDRELKRGQQQQVVGQDEYFSQRGLVGSNVEADARAQLAGDTESQRMQRLYDMNMALATTQGADRAAAGQLATQVQGQGDQREMFYADLNQRESEFARSYGLNEKTFAEQSKQWAASMAEQIAGRLQQEGQFTRQLAQGDTQFAIETGLRTRALDLQEQGQTADDAFRNAELQIDAEIRRAAQALEREGMTKDDAYRYAALSQDATFQQRAQELQLYGLDLNAALQQAAQDLQAWQANTQAGLQSYEAGSNARLSYLDILTRALGDPNIDPTELSKALSGFGFPTNPGVVPYLPRAGTLPQRPNLGGGAGGGGGGWTGGGGTGGGGAADSSGWRGPGTPAPPQGFGPWTGQAGAAGQPSIPDENTRQFFESGIFDAWQSGGYNPAEGPAANRFMFGGQEYSLANPDDLTRFQQDVQSGRVQPRNQGEWQELQAMSNRLGVDATKIQIKPLNVLDYAYGGSGRDPIQSFNTALGTPTDDAWFTAVGEQAQGLDPGERDRLAGLASGSIWEYYGAPGPGSGAHIPPEVLQAMDKAYTSIYGENYWEHPEAFGFPGERVRWTELYGGGA